MRRTIACVSDLSAILNEANIQLSKRQKDAVADAVYPHIEHSRMEAYKFGKLSAEARYKPLEEE